MMQAPIISTERLRLRPHVLSDMDALWDFYQSDRAHFMDKPTSPTHMWYGFTSEIASWNLCGWGGWGVETHDGALIGQVSLLRPPHFAELELGWLLFDAFEGKGYAQEAADAARDYAFSEVKADTLVSYISPNNTRSIKLAQRLGAFEDRHAKRHDPGDVVYRHPHPDERMGGMEAYA